MINKAAANNKPCSCLFLALKLTWQKLFCSSTVVCNIQQSYLYELWRLNHKPFINRMSTDCCFHCLKVDQGSKMSPKPELGGLKREMNTSYFSSLNKKKTGVITFSLIQGIECKNAKTSIKETFSSYKLTCNLWCLSAHSHANSDRIASRDFNNIFKT